MRKCFTTQRTNHMLAIIAAVVYAVIAVQSPGSCVAQWPMHRCNTQRTGCSPWTATYEPDVEWSFATGINTSVSPVIGSDGTVYYGALDKYMYAVGSDGTLSWRFMANSYVTGSAAVASDGSVIFGTTNGRIYALTSGGASAWSVPFSFTPLGTNGAILIDDCSSIIFGGDNGMIYGLTPDGTENWTYSTYSAGSGAGGPVKYGVSCSADEQTLYASCGDGYVHAIGTDGSFKWISPLIRPTNICAVGDDGAIYAGSEAGILYALNDDGTIKWDYQASSKISSAPAIGPDGTIYFGSQDRHLYALNPDGSLKWRYSSSAAIYSAPSIDARGTVIFGTWSGSVMALDPMDGSVLWSEFVGSSIYTSPAIGMDGSIYVLGSSGVLTKLSGPTPATPELPTAVALGTGLAGMAAVIRRNRRPNRPR